MHPMQKQKNRGARGFKNGGRVYGPGTGTSDDVSATVPDGSYIMPADSVETLGERDMAQHGAGMGVVRGKGFGPSRSSEIPVNLSNGEHALSPEQVQQIGAATLDVVRGATHEPVGGGRGARGFSPGRVDETFDPENPPMFFADGGQVTEEERRRRLLAQIPVGGPQFTPPAAAPAAEAPRFMDSTRTVLEQSGAERSRLAAAGDGFGAAGEALRGATALVPAVAQDVFGEPIRLAGSVANGVARGANQFLTGSTGQAATPTPAIAPAPAAATSSMAGGVGDQPLTMEESRRNVTGAAMGTQPGNTAPFNPADAGAVTRVGNSYSGGPNVSGDITVNGAAPAGAVTTLPAGSAGLGFRTPNAINMGAAEALAASQNAESLGRLMASGQIATPGAGPSLILPSGSFGFRRERNIVSSAQASRRNFDRATGNDPESLKRSADLNRVRIEQQGANQRAAAGATNDARRIGIDATRAASDARAIDSQIEARGFGNRALAQQERLRDQIADPNSTPAQRQQAQQALQALSARADQPKFTVVPGGQEWDDTAKAMRNVPARVINNQTGQFMDSPGAAPAPSGVPNGVAQPKNKAEYDALPKGAQYTKNGITYTKS